ncbi:hypothetical protein GCM10010116_09380 [Microbispora rosea subsp. aerata]|nr:hypothetical protein GCM10010116_09380 [Microbispora rosea subsp. aerata]GIH56284.1 hypothetical protein Mro02_31980 [Microbispora rosea subsp. aerata]GLJ82276.1 hypothetical protein GCM10017588_10010 [Microbispora rosea subsp. aerata]
MPVRENGVVVEWVGTCTDVEQEWQEERRCGSTTPPRCCGKRWGSAAPPT